MAPSQYAHTACAALNACPSNQIGEVNANVQALLPAGEPPFSIHSDDAPTFYVNGHPGPTDPAVRKLERDVAGLQAPDPYVGNGARADDGQHGRPGRGDRRCTWSTPTPTARRRSRCSETTTSSSRRRIRRSARRTSARASTSARSELRLEPRRRAGGDREHLGRVRRPRSRASRGRLADVDGPHEPAADDPGPDRAQGRLPHDGRVLVEALRPARRRPRSGRPSRRSWAGSTSSSTRRSASSDRTRWPPRRVPSRAARRPTTRSTPTPRRRSHR